MLSGHVNGVLLHIITYALTIVHHTRKRTLLLAYAGHHVFDASQHAACTLQTSTTHVVQDDAIAAIHSNVSQLSVTLASGAVSVLSPSSSSSSTASHMPDASAYGISLVSSQQGSWAECSCITHAAAGPADDDDPEPQAAAAKRRKRAPAGEPAFALHAFMTHERAELEAPAASCWVAFVQHLHKAARCVG